MEERGARGGEEGKSGRKGERKRREGMRKEGDACVGAWS